jgi:hypothetical protein
MDHKRSGGPHGKEQKGNNAGAQSALAKRGEEAMAGLKTQGINKDNHTDDVNILRQAQAMVESAKRHPHEKNSRNAKPESEETDIAEKIAQTDNREQNQQGILNQ